MVGASPDTDAVEKMISSCASGLLPVKRPRLKMRNKKGLFEDKGKENSKEAHNKKLCVEDKEPSERGRRPYLNTYSVSRPTLQKSCVMDKSKKKVVNSSEFSINEGDHNDPINIPSVIGNVVKPSPCHSNNSIINKEMRPTKKRWTYDEKKLIVDYFHGFFQGNRSPGTNRCKAFVQEFHDKLCGRNATQVYTFINNVLTNKIQLPEELLHFY